MHASQHSDTHDPQQTVGQLVADHPRYARTFEQLGIDYCCGGGRTLEEACRAKGLDAATVLTMLDTQAGPAPSDDADWTDAGITALCDHIEQTHHAYLRRELPRLRDLIDKVARKHGQTYPWMVDVQRTFAGLADELAAHMQKEEQMLFPAIRQQDAHGGAGHQCQACGDVSAPIQMMEQEHDDAGRSLARLNELTGGYAPPADACNTHRAVLAGLSELEQDMHTHVHKENNILFPRAMGTRA